MYSYTGLVLIALNAEKDAKVWPRRPIWTPMIRDSKIQTESLVAGAESPLVSTYSFSKPLSSKFRVVVFLIHEGPRRTATSFGPRRARRTATATSFCPRRAAKGHEGPRRDHEELQRQNGNGSFFLFMEGREEHLYLILEGRGGPRKTATTTPLSAEDTEGRGELQRQLLFVHEGPRRTPLLTTKDSKGHEEHLFFIHEGHHL